MRAILSFAVLSIGVSGVFTAGVFAASAQPFAAGVNDQLAQSIVRAKKGDRLVAPRLEDTPIRGPLIEEAQTAFAAESAEDAPAPSEAESTPAELANSIEPVREARAVHRIPLEEFCDVLISSARANDLPIVFFTNLIWQESRFNPNSVSRAGAQGVAQFMPETAAANGLDNPFNPFQAVPASAHLLRQLHEQFGNVGLAAAAYNAGPGRVTKWLAKRGSLPRETRAYVVTITGRPAEQWRAAKPQMTFKPAPDLPCSHTPAFTELKAAESEENGTEGARAEVPIPKTRPVRLFAAHSRPSSSQSASTVTIKGSNVTIKGSKNPHRRLAARGSLKVTSKTVQLTLIAPEPGQAATNRQKKKAAAPHEKGRKSRRVRLASTSP